MSDPKHILSSAKSILLVDWSSPTIPRTLVEAGFTVFCASPGRYSIVELVSEPPAEIDSNDIVRPQHNEQGYLVFRRLPDNPSHVDIVNVYRPENEHEAIVVNQLVPLGARVLWLQPSIASGTAQRLALEYGFKLIEGVDIAGAAR
jgi:predicted CoA-binding protein